MPTATPDDPQRPIPFRSNRLLQLTTIAYGALWLWAAINPLDRYDWLLENLMVFASLIFLVATYPFFRFSNRSYILIAFLLALHTFGSKYTYAETPFDTWLNGLIQTDRNNYDRLVHFAFGLLILYPVDEVLRRLARLTRAWSLTLGVAVILAGGAFYELIEMWVATAVAPDLGAAFLGSQGDPWDAVRDIEMALYGALLTVGALLLAQALSVRRHKKTPLA